jgi:Asp-tRNA(Asn)/Glu-tRNA(Gln) amidotransferase A subunit family amidase
MSAVELRAAYAAGDLSPREVCTAVLERLELLNPALRAFLNCMGEAAGEQAAAAEAEWSTRRRRGETLDAPPLLGVPVSVKDTVDVAGAPTTMGSLLANRAPAVADELFIERLRASGAVLIGKTNTSEFGLAAHTTNRLGDPCVNPWNTTRTAGGSSGGAAAACAAGLGPLHHGSDGGGSVRIPAAYCGVVGLKPTGRRVARRARGAGMSQFEVDGALARTVQDAAIMVSAMSGMDDRDPAPYRGDTPDLQSRAVAGDLRDLTLSAPRRWPRRPWPRAWRERSMHFGMRAPR